MIMTKEHKQAYEWEYIRGRKEAISEFKEIIEKCKKDFRKANMEASKTSMNKSFWSDVLNGAETFEEMLQEEINKTAQEIKG